MDASTVNISFKKDLLQMIDQIAKEEARSRSELIREAARMYIERKKGGSKYLLLVIIRKTNSVYLKLILKMKFMNSEKQKGIKLD
ncbi:MAG: ribbon-helix-helix domain-containing protein [Desulfobacterales bacterium]